LSSWFAANNPDDGRSERLARNIEGCPTALREIRL
jgi:hypothetical protein